MLRLREPYALRPVHFLELWEHQGWQLKVYGIAYQRSEPSAELVEAAKAVARERLPQPATDVTRYGVGFVGVHEGRGSNFVFVDWWADENELHHHAYVSLPEAPAALIYVTPTGLAACVWDLRVLAFEREAWVGTVLANPSGPDFEAYLALRLNESV